MAKKHKIPESIRESGRGNKTATNSNKEQSQGLSLKSFRIQASILSIIGFLFYCNTLTHEYAFDDMMAIVDNDYVQRGIAGIPDILTHDAYQSYLEHKIGGNQLAGGRYRPLSLVTFAIEQQFLGIYEKGETDNSKIGSIQEQKLKETKLIHDMYFRHLVNVLLYILSVIALLYFFRKIVFPNNALAAFLAALIFTIHPLHTEVVANVKSRDEILSVLFSTLTFIMAFKYWEGKEKKFLIWALVCFFLALLSKEYGITLVLLLPLSYRLFRNKNMKEGLIGFLPFIIPLGIYLILRFSSVTGMSDGAENNIMNNPYLYASNMQKLASELMVMLNYIKFLLYPHPLVADYSYHQIPYTDFTNPLVWISVVVFALLSDAGFLFYRKRNPLSFAIAFFGLNMLLISNLFFNIGAPMGERLMYHSSVGFCIALGYLINFGFEKIQSQRIRNLFLSGFMLLVVAVSCYVTLARNADWKNNETLFLTDVKKAPNSVLLNNDAAAACMNLAKSTSDTPSRKEWFGKAIGYFSKAIEIHPQYINAYLNRGLCYFNTGMVDKALTDWVIVRKYSPNQPNLAKYLNIAGQNFFLQGMRLLQLNKPDEAIVFFRKSDEAVPNIPDVWYNLAVAYNANGDIVNAKKAIDKAVKLAPNNNGFRPLYVQLKQMAN